MLLMNRRHLSLAAVVVLIAAGTLYAKKHKPAKPQDQRQRAMHALDRLTFGPRPGDVQAVMRIGVEQWIEQQLHPENVDDSGMQMRLAGYRTLTMSTRQMAMAFPPNFVAKAVMDGKMPMPSDPYSRAIYAAAIDRIEHKEAEKQQQAQPTTAAANAVPTNTPAPKAMPGIEPAEITERQLARRETRSVVDDLIALPADQRMRQILALPVAEQHNLLPGLP